MSEKNPFGARSRIEDPSLFVGREEILWTLVSRVEGAQPTSINIFGPRRIGKSSLLYHFYQTWEQRVAKKDRFVVIYLSLQDADCASEQDFYKAVARKLLAVPKTKQNKLLVEALEKEPLDQQGFSAAMQVWKAQGRLPVLCLDKFKALLDKPNRFDKGFYDNLRSLMDGNALMLIISSEKPIKIYAKQKRIVSDFFNLGQEKPLGKLTQKEAEELISRDGLLSVDEQEAALEWGGRHPYLLQLAGQCLWDARQLGRDQAWAKGRFQEEARNVPTPRFTRKKWMRAVRQVCIEGPKQVGRLPKKIGEQLDDISSWVVGVTVILIVAWLLMQFTPLGEIWAIVQRIW